MELDSVLISGTVAAAVALILYFVPIRPTPTPAPNASTALRLSKMEAKYDEISGQNADLRNELNGKLVEYTDAYHRWSQREDGYRKKEDEYRTRIRLLEAEVKQLLARIRELEQRAGVDDSTRDLVVIGVWPDAGLDTDAEADAIYNAGFTYRKITGDDATRSGIIREIARNTNGHRLIIEIGSHGTDEGTVLHDGDIAEPGWWRRVLRDNARIELVVLMACESDAIGDALRAEDIPVVISVQSSIADADAIAFVRALYNSMSHGNDIKMATAAARLHVSRAAFEAISIRTG